MTVNKKIGQDPKKKIYTKGPLKDASIGGAAAPFAVPLMGDATTLVGDELVSINDEVVSGAKNLTDGPHSAAASSPSAPGNYWNRQDFTDWGTAHGKSNFLSSSGHDRILGNLAFADGHVSGFKDIKRDNMFDSTAAFINGWNTQKYDDLEGKVYGGWLTHKGLNW